MNNVFAQSVSTSGPTSTNRGIAVTTFCEAVNSPNYTSGAGWTMIATVSSGAAEPSFISDYREFTTAAVVSETVMTDNNAKYAAVIATFR